MLAALFTPFSAAAAGGVSIAYDKDSEILTINSDKIQTAALIHAAYDDSGKLTDLRTENIALPYSTSRAMFPGAENKIMVWDSMDGMKSLCDPYTLTVEKEPAPEWKDGISVCAPYDYVYGTAYEQFSPDINRQHFKMAGKDYTDGFVLQTTAYVNAEAMFNLDDRYDAVKFKYGHVDGTSNRNVTLNIYLDRKLVQSVPLSYDTGVQEIEINTAGAMGMRFEIEDIGSGYGFTEFQFLSKSRPEKQPYKGNWMSEFPPYELTYTTLCDRTKYETINMSGYEYTNGFTMSAAYTDAEAIFNLQGRCTNLTFTAGHVDGSNYRSVTLEVYLDRELAYEIPLYYYDVAREYSISLLNKNGEPAHQMKFKINDIGSAYGFADGTFSFTEDTRVPTEGNWTKVFAPYEYSYATAYRSEQNQWATMSGEQYTDGFVMTGSGAGEAIFNLEGKCTELTFTVGHIDGALHQDRTLIVYLDTIPVEQIPLYYDDVAREHTVSLINPQTKEPAQQMKLAIEDIKYYSESWGFFRGKFNYTAEPSSPTSDNNWTKVFPPYEYSYAQIYRDGGIDGEGNYDKFTMSGKQYTDGFVMTGSNAGEAIFNLEGKCTNLTFTVGHIDGAEHYNRKLNVYIDGMLDEKRSIDLRYDDVAREHTISLLNADGKPASTLKLAIDDIKYYNESWGFANGHFDYTEPPAAPALESTWLTDCLPYETTKNSVTIYRAGDEDESTFKMSGYDIDDGIVMQRNAGEALFNIGNQYSVLNVMVGHIDGTDHYNRTLNVYIDGALMNSYTLYYDRAAQEYAIPLLNSSGQPGSTLKLAIDDIKYYNEGWGFAYGRFE